MKLIFDEIIAEKGMTKRFVANKIGVNENTIRNWLNGKGMPKLDQALELAKILQCNINDLYKD